MAESVIANKIYLGIDKELILDGLNQRIIFQRPDPANDEDEDDMIDRITLGRIGSAGSENYGLVTRDPDGNLVLVMTESDNIIYTGQNGFKIMTGDDNNNQYLMDEDGLLVKVNGLTKIRLETSGDASFAGDVTIDGNLILNGEGNVNTGDMNNGVVIDINGLSTYVGGVLNGPRIPLITEEVPDSGLFIYNGGVKIGRFDYDRKDMSSYVEGDPEYGNSPDRLFVGTESGVALKMEGANGVSIEALPGSDMWIRGDDIHLDTNGDGKAYYNDVELGTGAGGGGIEVLHRPPDSIEPVVYFDTCDTSRFDTILASSEYVCCTGGPEVIICEGTFDVYLFDPEYFGSGNTRMIINDGDGVITVKASSYFNVNGVYKGSFVLNPTERAFCVSIYNGWYSI